MVATTIGLVVQDGDGEAVTLSPEMATMLAVSADGTHAAITTSAGHLQVWDVVTGQAVMTLDVAPDRFSSLAVVGDAVVAASEVEVVRFGFDGATTTLLTAPDGASLGPAVVDDAGNLAVPVGTAVPTVAVWSDDGTRSDVDLGLASGTRLTGVRWSGDGAQLAVLHAPPDSGDALGIWDVAAGRFTGTVALPNFVAPWQVAFADAERVVVPNFDRVVAYDLAGAEIDAVPRRRLGGRRDRRRRRRRRRLPPRWHAHALDARRDPVRAGTTHGHARRSAWGTAITTVDQIGLVRTFGADGALRRQLDRWAVGEATAVDLGADGSLVVATSTGAVRLLDPGEAAVAAILDRPQGDISDVSIAPDDRRVATGVSVQKAAEAWDDTIEVTDLAEADRGLHARRRGRERHRLLVLRGQRRVLARRHAAGVHVTRLHGPDLAARRPGCDGRARAARRLRPRRRVLARRLHAADRGGRRHDADLGRVRLGRCRPS